MENEETLKMLQEAQQLLADFKKLQSKLIELEKMIGKLPKRP